MMNTRFFKNIETLEDLKAQYKKLAMANHPDRGGDLETMKAINAEYDDLFKMVKDIHKTKEGKTYEKENNEAPEAFRNMMETLIRMNGVHIEIIGCFVWVSGETKPHKDQLKEIGFKWHSKKLCWYLAPADYKKRNKKQFGLDEIRTMYGVQFEADGESREKRLTA
ncbi:molecular chaperone DnaJ [Senimuribacter intestinalis]|uniref:molecular chaperone DnaJ n=1 Tax=Senimuribacter intestinalis TaxID=2941507 RepID=UPI0020400004|nr:molecular chaperone DnaJ [Senimuribacter intestinalis]